MNMHVYVLNYYLIIQDIEDSYTVDKHIIQSMIYDEHIFN